MQTRSQIRSHCTSQISSITGITAEVVTIHWTGSASGTGDQQKKLPVQGVAKVRTFLALGTLLAQLAMIVNSIWGMPLHNISHMMAGFT